MSEHTDKKRLVRVRDIMKTKFDMIDGLATVDEALHTMKYTETKTLIVKKRNPEDEYGILLIPDIARLVLAKDKAPDRVNIYEVMTKPTLTVSPDMDIRYCARLFDHFDISRAPVVEYGEIIGLVSLTDMVLRGMM
ncbi:CBS domain-containing protein [Candidatus Venteria ishoeyi]|uniref:Putative voltage-gated ClC-type chloride channel ClcB n=1 Tax=Candidatus Venteria ishoeyi TaxID=1899563 RepID=A0A1H6F9S6_9GAMM|nr:CBS domain-containing protein [Candidatus Venteria ishoeyi]MDM8548173.1 CBS domain-containing protein [Candidatus Venteria ishoeyi]SEH05906.1 putative voltage-gated ClC-type chloride channel ClcB [Candidatus Venteria ishoeyi]